MDYVRMTFDWILGIKSGKKCGRLPNEKGEIIPELQEAKEALHQDVDLDNHETSIMSGTKHDVEAEVLAVREADRFIKNMGIRVTLTHANKTESEEKSGVEILKQPVGSISADKKDDNNNNNDKTVSNLEIQRRIDKLNRIKDYHASPNERLKKIWKK